MTNSPRHYLRLVRSGEKRETPELSQFEQVQGQLVPVSDRVLCIATADAIDEGTLRHLVETLRPAFVLDFRTAPRFDFGQLNRLRAFRLFDSVQAKYCDFATGTSPLGDTADAIQISKAITEVTTGTPSASVLVLVDVGTDYPTAGLLSIEALRSRSPDTWELLLLGSKLQLDDSRDVVFISHANPEDNEFVLWLQIQLTRLGYETWSDLSHLKAGEIFWDSIEKVIRDRAVKVIAVASKVAMQKPGFLDEVSLAIAIERSAHFENFVIPVRVDDLPYGEFRANLARKNILDFTSGWASGLSRLVDTLIREGVPRVRAQKGQSLASWWSQQKHSDRSVANIEELLSSNRYALRSLPERLYAYSGTPQKGEKSFVGLTPFKSLWLSFSSPTELSAGDVADLTLHTTLSADAFSSGASSLTASLTRGERQRLLHRMLNRQWEEFLLARGLRLYDQSGTHSTPYIPDGLIPKNTVHFPNEDGSQSRRILVGFSTKRKLYWHLAPFGYFSTQNNTELFLKLRIVFSEDGEARWPSTERIKTMRRSFCKNWWNDRWRALQLSLMAWLASSGDSIVLYSGESGTLSIDSRPVSYLSPRSIVESLSKSDSNEDDSHDSSDADELLDDEDVADEGNWTIAPQSETN